MATFDCLPYETRADILSRLSQANLFRTSLVSHDWCAISEPLLYRAPELWEVPGDPSTCYPFVRTLLTLGRERLVGLVRSLAVYCPDPPFPENAIVPYAAPHILKPDPHGTGVAHVLLLMHLLPRLHTLHLTTDGPPGGFQTFIEAHYPFSHVSMLPLGLQSLRQFHWDHIFIKPRTSIMLLLTMLRLPCMQTVHVVLDNAFGIPVAETAISTAALTGTSTVTSLALAFQGVSCQWLIRILLIPRALTYLSCTVNPVRPFDLSHVGIAFQPLKNSLNHLNLEVRAREEHVTNDIGPLRDWPVLRSVRISLIALPGVAYGSLAYVLPVCLQDLHIIGSSNAVVVGAVVPMLDQKEAMLPRLERLAGHVYGITFPDWMDVVEEACAAAGVEFVDSCFPWITLES